MFPRMTMRWIGVLALLLAASSAARADDPADAERWTSQLSAAMTKHDPKAVESLLGSPIRVSGLWFEDAACSKQFGTRRTVPTTELGAFAACLAKLKPIADHRTVRGSTIQLVAFAPGIELAARVKRVASVMTLTALASLSYADDTPTILPALLETFRTAGDANPKLTAEAAAKYAGSLDRSTTAFAEVWFEVCVDAQGAVASSHEPSDYETYAASVEAGIQRWKFKPIQIGRERRAACSWIRFTYPAGRAPAAEVLPPPPPPPPPPPR